MGETGRNEGDYSLNRYKNNQIYSQYVAQLGATMKRFALMFMLGYFTGIALIGCGGSGGGGGTTDGGTSGTVSPPTFSISSGTYTTAQSVALSTTTPGATIRYTTDGSTPTSTTGTVYNGLISVSITTTFNAIAYRPGMTDSLVSTATYTITSARGTTYYVDATGGNDSNPGTAADNAWKTIAKVNGYAFSPGESILFKKGESWSETLTIPSSGSAGYPITFSSYGTGAAPVISADNTRYTAVNINSKSHITVSNLDIKGAKRGFWYSANILIAGNTVDDAKNIIIDDVTVKDGANGIRILAGRDIKIINSVFGTTTEIDTSQGGDGIYISSNADGVYPVNVTLDGNTFNGVFGRTPIAIVGADNLMITNNTVTTQNDVLGHRSLIDLEPNATQHVYNIWIGNNTMISNVGINNYAISVTAASSTPSYIDNVYIYNNSISVKDGTGVSVGALTGVVNIYGNTFMQLPGTTTSSAMIVGSVGPPTLNVYRNYIKGLPEYTLALTLINGGIMNAYYNVIEDVHTAFYMYGPAASVINAYNNTVYKYYAFGFRAGYDESNNTCCTITARNNILYEGDNNNRTVVDYGGLGTYDYNIYYHTSINANQYQWRGSNYQTFALWKAGGVQDAHSYALDPQMINPSGGNFGLLSTSPAINAGINVGLTADYAGNTVPSGSAPDIGANEFME